MDETILIKQSRVLLVEGDDDFSFFDTLARKLNLREAIQIIDFKGVQDLRGMLDTIRLVSNNFDTVTHLGIVRDYESAPNPFQSVQDALRFNNLPAPDTVNILAGDDLKVIVTLLPDSSTPGMLEDLCWRAFQEDSVTGCIDAYIRCLQAQGIKLLDSALPKAKMNILIASKSTDQAIRRKDRKVWRLSYAVQKRWWPWDHPAFDEVKTFLERLATAE